MSDLRQRVPGHSLIEQLLREWDLGNIHPGRTPGEIVIDDEARGWYLGVHGERWVATRLALLGPEYTVLHSVPVGRGSSDIDHVVIGPTGVFTINTKYSPGKAVWAAGFGTYVGGRPENKYIRNLSFEVRRASERLSRAVKHRIDVTGLLVFVDPSHMSRKAPTGDGTLDLRVISDAELLAAIEGEAIYTPEQVASLSEAAALPGTWHDFPHESTLGSHIAKEFVALEEAVGPSLVPTSTPKPVRKTPASSTNRPTKLASKPRRGRSSSRNQSTLGSVLTAIVLIGFGLWLLSIFPAIITSVISR
jgi:hypothetical protein